MPFLKIDFGRIQAKDSVASQDVLCIRFFDFSQCLNERKEKLLSRT